MLTVTDVMCRLYCTVKALLRVQYVKIAQGGQETNTAGVTVV